MSLGKLRPPWIAKRIDAIGCRQEGSPLRKFRVGRIDLAYRRVNRVRASRSAHTCRGTAADRLPRDSVPSNAKPVLSRRDGAPRLPSPAGALDHLQVGL